MLSSRSLNSVIRGGLAASLVMVLVAVLNLAAWPHAAGAQAVTPPAAPETARYFAQTGHILRQPLLALYNKLGGEPRWGAPMTEQYDDGGLLNQVFQRGALQYDSTHGGGWARALGSEVVAGHAVQPAMPAGTDGFYVAESGHNVGPAF